MSILSSKPAAALALVAALGATVLAGCSKDEGSTEAFCQQVRKVPALETVLSRFSEADPGALQDRIDRARAAYADLAEAAPSGIAGETDAVVDVVDEILDAVQENPDDPAKASAQLRAAMADHDGVAKDRTAVADYAKAECGVQLDATLTDSGTGTSTSTSTSTTVGDDGGTTTTTG